MIPSVLSSQLKRGLIDYVDTTFQITTPLFQDTIKKLLEDKNKIFREPYVSVKLPFRKCEEYVEYFEGIKLKFPPYIHQKKSFERLNYNSPKSTLIATGTGSGKTECFLYPILEYCYRHRGEAGIKAILIYPMNALATDQAKRLAELINTNDKLRGNVKAGMFVGDKEEHPSKGMSKSHIITDKDVLRENPPDILLTNYKMLDYLLLRPNDTKLWNKNNPASLKFIAVDELHTFDGAQGTDLAVLIRRLKARLYTPPNYLCCIGTSATMGSKEHGQALRKYASDIFGEEFDESSIITEDRVLASEFFEDIDIKYIDIPSKDSFEKIEQIIDGDFDEIEYIKECIKIWFNKDYDREYIATNDCRVKLSNELKHCKFFRDLVETINSKTVEYNYLFEQLSSIYIQTNKDINDYDYFINLLESMLALTSYARLYAGENKTIFFLQVHIQIWLKELRRLVAKVDKNVELELSDSLNDEEMKHYLPLINCRDCGVTGWVTRNNEDDVNLVISDLREFYSKYFKNDTDIKMLFPINKNNNHFDTKDKAKLCPKCMKIRIPSNVDKCFNCNNTDLIDVYIPSIDDLTKRKDSNGCPCCGSSSGLALIGARSATLISAGISEVFASKFNDDKKVLTFSDSVQDASHRAGFFNSRTWKFTLRGAIQKYVLDGGKNMNLKEFATKFNTYWENKLGIEGYISTFIPPDMTWRKAYEEMIETGRLNLGKTSAKSLLKDVKQRVELEIYYEYGFNSRMGRTLEKSGASIIELDYKYIDKVIDRILTKITNECERLEKFSEDELKKIILGVLIRLKIDGGIYKESLRSYIDNEYRISTYDRWMPTNMSKNPSYLALNSLSKSNYSFTTIDNRSWYYKWMKKNLMDISIIVRNELPNEVYKIILNELVKSNVLLKINTKKKNTVYAINDEVYTINDEVEQVICNKCGHSISISKNQHEYVQGMYCFRNECNGKYENIKEGLDFYGKLYSNGDLCRVYAKEHTGLLERDTREKVENDFKKSKLEQRPWDTNVLSCTPTLEMGIDIGDLSTVILCSVPPGQAQYQQRVGRAGRRDGNAMSIVVANNKNHDLYFYEDPEQMISTVVEPPSIFLDASAVLQRQFIAYCFDTWVKTNATARDIPIDLKKSLASINKPQKNIFPYNFIEYIDNNLSWIFPGFIDMFRGKISNDSQNQLKEFVYGNGANAGSFRYKIIDTFKGTEKERKSLKSDITKLNNEISKLDGKVKDQSYENEKNILTQEKKSLQKIVRDIENKNIFNYLSDEGLLPNYAFPESGVTLKSIIYRKINEENDNTEVKNKTIYSSYEYQRAAASAIHELAPENKFYVDGNKITIDRIDVKMAEPEYWRLCPSCNHAEIDRVDQNVSQCPHCGDLSWADSGQRKQMLKLKMVYSLQEYSKSKSDDESDDREQKYFCRQMLVDVDSNKDITDAYMLDGVNQAFGFEFIQKAIMREVNFGEVEGLGEQVTVAGKKSVRTGFKVCRYCGKVQNKNQKEPIHSRTCKARNYKKNTIDDCLYLYRQFESEAIRILVPSINIESSNQKLQSFIASVMLGLKKHFGSVEHLKICICEEPVENSALRKSYLVIYDTVPGGTGYLKQLMKSKEPIMDILQKALDVINACDCKDGCYKCLYAYKQSNQINEISKNIAREMLSEILKERDKLVKIKTIDDILVNSLFDSELEKKFIEALSRKGKLEKQMINKNLGYRFEIGENIWDIQQQVNLGYEDGVIIDCKPDFILYPSKNNSQYIKPIAVFTDGYTYHKDSIGTDMAKRMAIVKSKNYYIWSLSWKDVDSVFRNEYEYFMNYISPSKLGIQGRYNTFLDAFNVNDKKLYAKNSFELLLYILENPKEITLIRQLNFIYILALSKNLNAQDPELFNEFFKSLSNQIDHKWLTSNFSDLNNLNSQMFFNIQKFEENLSFYTSISEGDIKKYNVDNSLIISILDDDKNIISEDFEKYWNGFMRMYNFFQFSTNSLFFTTSGLDNGVYNRIFNLYGETQCSTLENTEVYDVVSELMELCDESCYELLNTLRDRKLLYPDACGYELVNKDGMVIGECELAWSEYKVALIIEEHETYRKIFEDNGWKVFSIKDYNLDDLKKSLELQTVNS